MNTYKFCSLIFIWLSIAMAQGFNPCDDERFLELKTKSLDDMSDREYEYFNEKNKECSEYKKSSSYKKRESKGFAEKMNDFGGSINNEVQKEIGNIKKSSDNKKIDSAIRKLNREEILKIKEIAILHANEDKSKNISLPAFLGTAVGTVLLSPVFGPLAGVAGIATSYYLASEKTDLTPNRNSYMDSMAPEEKKLYLYNYKKERGKLQSTTAVKAATGGCCSVWILLYIAIRSAVKETVTTTDL